MLTDSAIASLEIDVAALFSPISMRRKIGLAVSGGPDSLAMMLLVHVWAKSRAYPEVHVFSVDHRLRAEAAEEVELVGRYASELGFAFHPLTWDGEKPGTGIQAAARAARYQLMQQEMAELDIAVLLTAHHADDQAETILMRLAHKSGVKGLSGIKAWRKMDGGSLFRPLLDLSKAKLAMVVEAAGWSAAQDPSNENDEFERVRWRGIMPELAELGLDADALATMARRIGRLNDYATFSEWGALKDMLHPSAFAVTRLDKAMFLKLHPEMAIRHLQSAVAHRGGGTESADLAGTEALYESLCTTKALKTTFGGCQIWLRQTDILLFREVGRVANRRFMVRPQQTLEWDRRFHIANETDQTLEIGAPSGLTRVQAEAFLGQRLNEPVAAVRAEAGAWDQSGQLVGLGPVVKLDGLSINLM